MILQGEDMATIEGVSGSVFDRFSSHKPHVTGHTSSTSSGF